MSDIWLKRLKSLEDALEKNIVRTNIVVGSFGKIEYILDFSARDKMFKNKIADLESLLQKQEEFLDMKNIQIDELKRRIAELERKENIIEVRVPASPIEIATHLINNTCTINELKMIAEHINVYCNGGK